MLSQQCNRNPSCDCLKPFLHRNLVEGEGFEPSKAEPSDLQSDPFDRSGTPPKERAIIQIIGASVNHQKRIPATKLANNANT